MLKCNKCLLVKDLDSFQKNNVITRGYQYTCKPCVKENDSERFKRNMDNPKWREKDAKRQRDRYKQGLVRKQDPKQWVEASKKRRIRYPEKCKAADATKKLAKTNNNMHWHHWSYNTEHHLDVIELEKRVHIGFHRFITYDKETMMYFSREGELLDTKGKHLDHFNKVKDLI